MPKATDYHAPGEPTAAGQEYDRASARSFIMPDGLPPLTYVAGLNGFARDAGKCCASIWRFCEMMTSTTMVAR